MQCTDRYCTVYNLHAGLPLGLEESVVYGGHLGNLGRLELDYLVHLGNVGAQGHLRTLTLNNPSYQMLLGIR